jgi:CRP/FNR family transcriptional regulator, cyclic AMP receptor protein
MRHGTLSSWTASLIWSRQGLNGYLGPATSPDATRLGDIWEPGHQVFRCHSAAPELTRPCRCVGADELPAQLHKMRCNDAAMCLQASQGTLGWHGGVGTRAPKTPSWEKRDEMASTLGHGVPVDLLRQVVELADCTDAQLEEVGRLAEHVQVSAGEVLTREGRIGREFFFLLEGNVAVTQRGQLVNTLSAGQFFGELAAVEPGPRTATVTALTDLDVLIIGPREFAVMMDIPGFRDSLMRSMARRLRAADTSWAQSFDQDSENTSPPDN